MSSHQQIMTVLVLYPEHEYEQRIAFEERPVPVPERGEVLVRVRATTIGGRDKELFAVEELGWRSKRRRAARGVITGYEFSGTVVTSGERFKEGDDVYGYTNFCKGGVTHAEFVCVSEHMISYKPVKLSHVQAATIPVGCMTSIQALQNLAGLKKRQRILLSGATGGVGMYAVQYAKLLGAQITAQGRSWHEHDLLRLGVESFIEYTREEILHSEEVFDVIFDVAGIWTLENMYSHLTSKGVYITTHPERDPLGIVSSFFTAKKSKYLYVSQGKSDVLENITALFDAEMLEPIVGSVSPFAEALNEFAPKDVKIAGRRVLTID
ncbi:NAD(P)-dependent alcohol dehydrogenase [Halodesulfovibrio marinisediminis]|uniref:NADPH:quinone reductase n=1 Tax=Halodesulfovibrio marinisediminis DSM 17456 TaxID=1121457 RepID=A0A1N6IDX2_9BACT|nr:NAD(P)-dependent alcohol dehydrogenase [Halodesulfovibrio marinisediminis]SIO30169.1 NADPH:quinone reductase [Halodesulfovibrio marinisediminis DSM 17456]